VGEHEKQGKIMNHHERETMAQETVVGLHPHKAAVLANALLASSTALDRAARSVRRALAEAMEDDEPLVAVLRGSAWMDEQGRLLQRVIDDIWQAEVLGHPRSSPGTPLPAVWRAPYAEAFDDPVEAMRAAERARQVWSAGADEGDTSAFEALTRLVDPWRDNAVFATAFAASYGVADVAELLRRLDENHGSASGQPAVASARAAFELALVLLGTSSRYLTLPWGFDDLVREVAVDFGRSEQGDEVVPRGARNLLALLFAPASVWDADLLLDATQQLVLPANAQARELQVPQSSGRGDDTRALVLAAVARNPLAAQRVLNDLPLDGLLSSANGYDDGGRALGEVLVAATRPGEGHPTEAMRRLLEWTAAHRDLPPLALDRLGAVIVPYLGSFRTPSFDDDRSIGDPLPGLAGAERRQLLEYAATRERSAVELRTGELQWARRQLDAVTGAPYDGRGIGVLASIDTNVADAVAAGALGRVLDAERRDDVRRGVWSFVIGLVADVADHTEVPFIGNLIELAAEKGIEHFEPEPLFLEHYAHGARDEVRHDEAMFEVLFMASLWDNREANHAFDDVPLPTQLVTGDPPRLTAFVEMGDRDFEAYLRWKQDERVKRATRWQELADWGKR
jgi:hypothetical protein